MHLLYNVIVGMLDATTTIGFCCVVLFFLPTWHDVSCERIVCFLANRVMQNGENGRVCCGVTDSSVETVLDRSSADVLSDSMSDSSSDDEGDETESPLGAGKGPTVTVRLVAKF